MQGAERICRAELKKNPQSPDILHLLALISKESGRFLRSLEFFDLSLKVSPRQPVVWSNKANLLRLLGRIEEADECYEQAVSLMPAFRDAWQNRGALELDRDCPEKAVRWFEKAQKIEANVASTTSLVESYLSLGSYDKASQLLVRMKKKWVGDLSLLVGEVRLLMARGQYAKAILSLEQALKTHPNKGFICYQLGLVYLAESKISEASKWLEQAVSISPDLIDAHRVLNNLYRESDDPRFLLSYAEAITKLPRYAPLYHNLAAAYLSVDEVDVAGECLSKAVEEIGRNPYLVHGLGVYWLRLGELNKATPLLKESLVQLPDNVRFLIDNANINLKLEDYKKADGLLSHAQLVEPNNQEIWAYYSVLWRLTDTDRYEWLNQYEEFIQQVELPFNESSEGYLETLKTYLVGLHTTSKEPLDQSVRNGTQSLDNLWRHESPIVDKFRQSLDQSIRSYIGALKKDNSHPFLKRIKESYRISGAWSVKLNNGGFHTNHVHPRGWLSCCTYVSLPETVRDSDTTEDGWIKFGETSLGLGAREKIACAIKPREGVCVFFPSFFWHGTNSFSSVNPRLTIPIDIDPDS